MVASCAGCNDMEPWSAMVMGLVAGVVHTFLHVLVLKFYIDDPLDAIAVHLGGGKFALEIRKYRSWFRQTVQFGGKNRQKISQLKQQN